MYNPYTLKGKTILITGASSGIGKTAAIECSKMGANVVITGRNEAHLYETLSLLEDNQNLSIAYDLNDISSLNDFVENLPLIDGFVNNAGTNKLCPISFIKENNLREVFQVNTLTPILLLKELVKRKKLRSGASVVFTSSISGLGVAATGNSAYTASKGAISAFVKVAALELSSKKIRVNAVCPGMVQTQMIHDDSIQEEELNEDLKKYPLGRYGDPKDIAWAMIYLLSDASAWVTGTNLIIDGGLTIR